MATTAYQQALAAARRPAQPYQEVRTPVTNPVQLPSLPAMPAVQPGSPLDPLGNVWGDVRSQAQRGAQVSPATGMGLGLREMVTSPVSRAMGGAVDMGRGAIGSVVNAAKPAYEAARAFVTGDLPSAQPVVAPVAAVAPRAPVAPVLAPANGGAAPAGVVRSGSFGPSATADQRPAAGMITRGDRQEQLRRAYAPTQYNAEPSSTPSLQPIAGVAPDPNEAIMGQLNSGTWSGMINARTMTKRRDADRAAAVAQQIADTGRFSAESGRMGAESGQMGALAQIMNANTNAAKGATDAAMTDQNIQNAVAGRQAGAVDMKSKESDLATKVEEAALRKAAAAGDEKALKKLTNLEAARKGKTAGQDTNEKLLEVYIRAVGEHNKNPANMDKPAPSFEDFLAGLPPGMFPGAGAQRAPMPAGMKRQAGTSGGKPVYEDANGKQFLVN